MIDLYDSWLFQEMQPYLGQRILEIGCGLGNLTHHLVDRELVVAMDISASSIAHVRSRYTDCPHVHAVVSDIMSDACLELAQYDLDTAISVNVFEHIEDDDLALEHTWQILVPGGTLLLVVPAHSWLYGSMDRAIGHFRRYSKRSLALKLEQAKFELLSQKYVNALAALGWFANGRVLKSQTPPQGQLKLMNPLIPLLQGVESLLSPPFGISLFAVARRLERS